MKGGGGVAEECLNAMALNNAYVDGQWSLFQHAGAMRLITLKARLVGVDIPVSPNDPTCKARPMFHIKEMCNTW